MGLFRSRKPGNRSVRFRDQPKTMSYYTNAPSGREPEPVKKSSALRFLQHLPSVLAISAIIFSIGYSLSLENKPIIKVLKADSGTSVTRANEEYESYAKQLLGGSILNKSKLTINTKSLEKKILAQFAEIEKAEISLSISSRRPLVTLFSADFKMILVSSGSRFALNDQGRALLGDQELAKAENLDLIVVNDESGATAQKGKQLLTREEVQFITEVSRQIKASGLTIESLTLPPLASELHLRVKDAPYVVKFNLRTNSREAVGTYLAVKKRLEAEGMVPKQYIDVRVEEKSFYQ